MVAVQKSRQLRSSEDGLPRGRPDDPLGPAFGSAEGLRRLLGCQVPWDERSKPSPVAERRVVHEGSFLASVFPALESGHRVDGRGISLPVEIRGAPCVASIGACGEVSSRFSVVRWRIGLRQYVAHRLEEPEARALVAAGKSASYGLGKTQTRSV